MNLRFPLADVKVEMVSVKQEVNSPLYSDGFYCMNQEEFSMDVKGVAWFYASGGNFISLVPYPDADKTTIELYLNGSAYGAILHQRKILPLHGSCFRYEGQGVMICGEAGAGKSSLTASFCLNGSEFLTDDVTPLLFKNEKPYIWALSDRIKLWGDTLRQLKQEEDGLHRIDPATEKFYFPMDGATGNTFRLDRVYIIEISDNLEVSFEELSGSSKFAALRNEIYRLEYLNGMPENKAVYFEKLIDISNHINVIRVKRPESFRIKELRTLVEKHLSFWR
jgi:hypothetical protein